MGSLNIRPYESNLRGSFTLASSGISTNSAGQANTTPTLNKIPAKLSVDKNTDSTSQTSLESKKVETDRQRVANKTSNQLFSSASTLSVRQSLTDNIVEGLNKLKDINEVIENEVDPTKKDALIQDANNILDGLQAQYDAAVADDPNLASNVNITSLVRPGEDIRNGTKFTEVSISAVLSPSDSGLSGIDFSDTEDASDKLDLSISNYSLKQKSYEATASEISGATSKAISKLKADDAGKEIDKKEEDAKKLADQINQSKENLVQQTKVSKENVTKLINESDDKKDEKDSKKQEKSDVSNTQAANVYAKIEENKQNESVSLSIAA